MWVGIIQSFEGANRTKRQRKGKPFSLCAWGEPSIFSCINIGTPDSWVYWLRVALKPLAPILGFQTRTELYHQVSTFSSLQMADGGTSWPPKPHEPVPIINLLLNLSIYIYLSSIYLSIYLSIIYLSLSYWFCLSGEPWLIRYVNTYKDNTTRAESLEECKITVVSLKDWKSLSPGICLF